MEVLHKVIELFFLKDFNCPAFILLTLPFEHLCINVALAFQYLLILGITIWKFNCE